MALIDSQQAPSQSMQRWFGLSLAMLLLILAYAFSHYGTALAFVVAGLGLLVGIVYYALPISQLPIIRGWQIVTLPLAFVISHLLLGIVFFGVFLPMGLFLRLTKYDPLRLRKEDRETEWVAREPQSDVSRSFKQF